MQRHEKRRQSKPRTHGIVSSHMLAVDETQFPIPALCIHAGFESHRTGGSHRVFRPATLARRTALWNFGTTLDAAWPDVRDFLSAAATPIAGIAHRSFSISSNTPNKTTHKKPRNAVTSRGTANQTNTHQQNFRESRLPRHPGRLSQPLLRALANTSAFKPPRS